MHSQVTSADRNPESMSSQVVTTSTLLRSGRPWRVLRVSHCAPNVQSADKGNNGIKLFPGRVRFCRGAGPRGELGLRTSPKSSLLYGMDGKSKFRPPQNYAILLAANWSRSNSCSGMFLSRPQSTTPSTTVLALSQTLANVLRMMTYSLPCRMSY